MKKENPLNTNTVLKIIREAGKMIRANHGRVSPGDIDRKAKHDFVTGFDRQVERMLVERLRPVLNGATFLTEEKTVRQEEARYMWIIDPIDGTTNFIHGLYPVCVSVALQDEGRTVWGAVYEVGADEMFYADDKGAFLNGNPIRVSSCETLDDALLTTGFPYKNYKRLKPYMKSFEYLMFNTSGLRRLGSAAADLAYVASGRLEGFYEYGLGAWDVAAGAFIVQQAGGAVSDFEGEQKWLYGGEMIADNGLIHEAFVDVLKSRMGGSV